MNLALRIASAALSMAWLAGCTPVTKHTRPLSEQSLREIAEEVNERDVTVEFGPMKADRFDGRALKVGAETTAWETRDKKKEPKRIEVPTAAIRDIIVVRRLAGAGLGLLIGGGVGILTGAAIGGAQSCIGDCTTKAVGPAVLGGLVGGLIGAFVGSSAGYKSRIDFADAASQPGARESVPVR